MGFFSNIGTAEVTNEYKKAIKKLNAAIKRHPENIVDTGDNKLLFVRTRKQDPAAFPFEGVTTYDVVCKGIMDFLTRYNPGNEYSYCKLRYISPADVAFRRYTANYDKDKTYLAHTLVLEFKSNKSNSYTRPIVKYYAIDNVLNLKDPDLIRNAITLYYLNSKK